MDHLYERVREARRLINLTQEQLALELGVTRGAVAQWEIVSGTAPSVENLTALARRSGMAFEYLATGRGPKVQGAPMQAMEERSPYQLLSKQQKQLLACFDALSPKKRAALVEFLSRFSDVKSLRQE